MKKLSKILVLVFVVICLPLLISCGKNSTSDENKKQNYSITFDFKSEFGSLSAPKFQDDKYVISFEDTDDINVAYIDSHGVDILKPIAKNTNLVFTIYISIFSSNIDIKINDNVIDYSISEQGDYQVLDFTYKVDNNIKFSMNGIFEMMF